MFKNGKRWCLYKLENIFKKIIKDSDATKTKRTIMEYLHKRYDSMAVKPMTDEILKGNLESIDEKDINQLLRLFGYDDSELDSKEDTQQLVINKPKNEELNNLQDLYNTTLIENKKLREQTAKQNDKLTNQEKQLQLLTQKLESMNQQLSGLSNLIKTLKLTDKKEKLVTADDEDIDRLYIENLSNGTKQLNNAYIIKVDNKIIIPKSYYEI